MVRRCSHAFSRAWRQLHVFASSCDWFIGLSVSVMTGDSEFGFGLTTLVLQVLLTLQVPNTVVYSEGLE